MELTAANTAIVVDSTADFPEAPDRFPNWRMVPLYVRFGDQSYRDYVELGPEAFYARLRTADELPTTSQPTPGDFLAAYEQLGDYDRIYSLHISTRLSGTYESARTAASELGDRVRMVDTETASAAITMLGLAIQRRLERGTTDAEIAALIDRYKDEHRLLFTVDTLEFLAKGGRIGRAAKFAGQMLHIKPILTIEDGEVLPLKRVRGNQKAMQEFVSQFKDGSSDARELRVGIAHADAPERAEALVKMVREVRPQAEIETVTTLGAVVGTHAGPGTVGFFWFTDDS
ncbi:MAG: fatty acid kinase fatty acid binding subunit [Gaiellaceae bacterium]|nr:fatty acid kinase fatty acid binding subunit [Gaiellaceae bacterium]MDX6493971.1 fatty acid kinase fatty acid binding subunit [Gaiellaceae bacterium]